MSLYLAIKKVCNYFFFNSTKSKKFCFNSKKSDRLGQWIRGIHLKKIICQCQVDFKTNTHIHRTRKTKIFCGSFGGKKKTSDFHLSENCMNSISSSYANTKFLKFTTFSLPCDSSFTL